MMHSYRFVRPIAAVSFLVWIWGGPASLIWAATVGPGSFRLVAPIQGEWEPNKPAGLALPYEVLQQIRSGFPDLRIYDDTGAEVPYVIHESRIPAKKSVRFEFKTVSYEPGEERDAIVLEQPLAVQPFGAVDIQTGARDFKKTVRLQASFDRETWFDLGADVLFDFSSRVDLRKTRIEFRETDARFLRIEVQRQSDPEETTSPDVALRYGDLVFDAKGTQSHPFRVDRVVGTSGPEKPETEVYDRISIENPEWETDEEGNSVLTLGRINHAVACLSLGVENPYFYRQVEVRTVADEEKRTSFRVGGGKVYRLVGMASPETRLPGLDPGGREVLLKVLNENNPPLKIGNVAVFRVRKNLYFFPEEGRSYTAYLGNENVQKPRYETEHLIPSDAAGGVNSQPAALGGIIENSAYRPSLSKAERESIQKGVLSIVVVLLVLGMGFWGYSLVRKLPAQTEAGGKE